MQYIIVTIRRDVTPGKPAMKYPAVYNAQEVDRNKKGPLVYDGGLGRGSATEECMIFIADAVATTYALDADIRIVTEAQANTWLAANPSLADLPEEVITDPDRMMAIIAKGAAITHGKPVVLTAEDEAALDPDNPMRGINKRLKTAVGIFGA